jgi:hypothetical protein
MARPILDEILTPAGHRVAQDQRLAAVVLLAGGAGTRAFSDQSRRSILQMPLSVSETVLGLWHSRVRALAQLPRFAGLSMILVGGERPEQVVHWDSPRLKHLHDPQELRGTGGVLRDITSEYPDEAYVLVASAASLVLEPLEDVADQLFEASADAALCADEFGTPGSLMLIRAGCLRSIAPIGFVDLKEQAMPGIAAAGSVAVLERRMLATASLRTPSAYIAALRRWYSLQKIDSAVAAVVSEFTEQWKPLFSIVEPGSEVSRSARIHDSVVLAGAHVGRDATVVRSVICPGARVPATAMVVDQIVAGAGNG